MIYDVTPITFNQLDLLSAGHPQGGFQQTGHMAHLAATDVAATDLIGVTRNGVLSAGCLIAWTRGRLGLEGSIWLGPLCALDDPKLLEHMTRGIRLAARRRHAVSVTCWPNIEYQRHDAAGNPIGAPDTMILDAYRSCGWRHQGFDTGYGKVVNRWNWIRTFDGIKDERTLLASYKPRTRWSVNRARTSGVRVRELGADELGMFVNIERKTAGRRGFTARDEDYYRRFKETFGSRARFMLAEIHADELLTGLTAEHDRLADRLDSLRTKYEAHATNRLKRQIDDTTHNLTALERRLDEARALTAHGSVIPAACALFVEHRRETVYLTAGALPEYRCFIDCDTDELLGIHPYWDPEVMNKRFRDAPDASNPHMRHDAVTYAMREPSLMREYGESKDLVAAHVRELLPGLGLAGQWSLDIMRDGDDCWLIDMAPAERSTFYERTVPKGKRRPMVENWMPELEGEH